jgi:hypothetical protein
MIYHLVALDDWLALPDRPYTAAYWPTMAALRAR